ncbi:hypothetical protein PL321_12240 [Caloramator sp. mosi_1]|uniref:hypothetical protein n=1 Tax=Caloramator sp. mosi_1 TaxID=3023090 RepID=UPI00236122BB|nr:hypothetical protein [Caloramator sp. mosi_1]WDC83480.1 hypothetical protein PL321_12240 [Caloramator sp. mosi_1]
MRNKIIRVAIILFIVYLAYINYYKAAFEFVFNFKSDYSTLKSIKYHVLTESYSESQGKFVKHQDVYFIYPNKLRIDTVSDTKTTEIYNSEKHYYYDEITNKIRVKLSFPPKEPYVVEISKKVIDVINSGRYEFLDMKKRIT